MAEALGMTIAMYLIMKVIEAIALRGLASKFHIMVSLSSLLAFVLICFSLPYQPRDPAALVPVYLLSALLIPAVRMVWHRRRTVQETGKATPSI